VFFKIKNKKHNNQLVQQQLVAMPRCPYASLFGLAFKKRNWAARFNVVVLSNIPKKSK